MGQRCSRQCLPTYHRQHLFSSHLHQRPFEEGFRQELYGTGWCRRFAALSVCDSLADCVLVAGHAESRLCSSRGLFQAHGQTRLCEECRMGNRRTVVTRHGKGRQESPRFQGTCK